MSPIELGKFIASLRNEKNLTQEELAEKLYIDKRKISRWECGTSIPEFEMLIKLSEILDVSLYELSICQKIENESLSRKIINGFKSIKDFKKYKAIKKIKIISLIIFFILFIITSTFTITHNNTIEIYEMKSLNKEYYIEGRFISTKEYSLFYIRTFNHIKNNVIDNSVFFNNCEYEIYDKGIRKIYLSGGNNNANHINVNNSFYEVEERKKLNPKIVLNIKCNKDDKNSSSHSFEVKLNNIYNNKIF